MINIQECQVIAPLQLYFSWKAAVGNMQVSSFDGSGGSLS